jgi:hypothetical protein
VCAAALRRDIERAIRGKSVDLGRLVEVRESRLAEVHATLQLGPEELGHDAKNASLERREAAKAAAGEDRPLAERRAAEGNGAERRVCPGAVRRCPRKVRIALERRLVELGPSPKELPAKETSSRKEQSPRSRHFPKLQSMNAARSATTPSNADDSPIRQRTNLVPAPMSRPLNVDAAPKSQSESVQFSPSLVGASSATPQPTPRLNRRRSRLDPWPMSTAEKTAGPSNFPRATVDPSPSRAPTQRVLSMTARSSTTVAGGSETSDRRSLPSQSIATIRADFENRHPATSRPARTQDSIASSGPCRSRPGSASSPSPSESAAIRVSVSGPGTEALEIDSRSRPPVSESVTGPWKVASWIRRPRVDKPFRGQRCRADEAGQVDRAAGVTGGFDEVGEGTVERRLVVRLPIGLLAPAAVGVVHRHMKGAIEVVAELGQDFGLAKLATGRRAGERCRSFARVPASHPRSGSGSSCLNLIIVYILVQTRIERQPRGPQA